MNKKAITIEYVNCDSARGLVEPNVAILFPLLLLNVVPDVKALHNDFAAF